MTLQRLLNLAMAAAICACLSLAHLLDAPGELRAVADTASATTDAEHQAAADLRRDLGAQKLCRDAHGEASFRWTPAGQLVCKPRRGKQVAAL